MIGGNRLTQNAFRCPEEPISEGESNLVFATTQPNQFFQLQFRISTTMDKWSRVPMGERFSGRFVR